MRRCPRPLISAYRQSTSRSFLTRPRMWARTHDAVTQSGLVDPHTHTNTHTHAHTHAHTHKHTHAHTHTRTHAHARTHTHQSSPRRKFARSLTMAMFGGSCISRLSAICAVLACGHDSSPYRSVKNCSRGALCLVRVGVDAKFASGVPHISNIRICLWCANISNIRVRHCNK